MDLVLDSDPYTDFPGWPWTCLIIVSVPEDLESYLNLTTISESTVCTLVRYCGRESIPSIS